MQNESFSVRHGDAWLESQLEKAEDSCVAEQPELHS